MRRVAACLLVAGCGRLGFGDNTRPSSDGGPDGSGADPHLIAYYPLDVLAQGITSDATGNGHDATCTACPLFELSPHGHAAHFTGTTQRLDVGDSPTLDTTAAFTVTAWIRVDSAPGSVGCFVNKRYGPVTDNSWQACVRDTLAILYSTAGTNPSVNSTQRLTLGTWSHVALRWDGVIKTLSLDGVDLFSIDAAVLFDGGGLSFGADVDSGSQVAPFPGSIDEIRIYDRALDISEIAALAGS